MLVLTHLESPRIRCHRPDPGLCRPVTSTTIDCVNTSTPAPQMTAGRSILHKGIE